MQTPSSLTQAPQVIVTFSPNELSQLEAFATLHGESVTAFVQRAALDAAQVTASHKTTNSDALWLSETSAESPLPETDLFAPVDKVGVIEAGVPEDSASVETGSVAPPPKRSVAGEPSKFAKGRGPVWEIRQALGRERVHGLGWTREQLAFVLKLSVVGVRKMEHLGTSPVKSLQARKSLLNLAQTLENPTPELITFIEVEDADLRALQAL